MDEQRPKRVANRSRASAADAEWWRIVVAAIGLVICVGGAFANSLNVPFLFDDYDAIVDGDHLHQLLPPPTSWWMKPDSPLASRPFAAFTFALNYAWGGLNPRGYHVVNVVLHVLNALLFFDLLRRTAARSTHRSFPTVPDTTWAFIVALIWGVHPLLVDAVTYITQRTELLMACCYWLTLWCATRAHESTARGWRIAAVVSCAGGMLSKEVMVSAPLMVIAYDRAFWYPSWREAWQARRGFYLALASTWLLLAAMMFTSSRGLSAGFGSGITVSEYLATQCVVIPHYLSLVVWPVGLCLDYGQAIVHDPRLIAAGGLLLVTLFLGTCFAWRRAPWLAFVGTWFFAILAPSSSFLPIATEIGAERRMYLPSAAVVLLLIVVLQRIIERTAWTIATKKRVFEIVLLVVAMALSSTTVRRNQLLASEVDAWADAVQQRPNNPRAHVNFGVALLKHRGDEQRAIEEFRAALAINPSRQDAITHISPLLDKRQPVEQTNLLYIQALAHESEHVGLLVLFGDRLVEQGRYDEAIAQLERATQLNPQHAAAFNGLAGAYARQGKLGEAEKYGLRAHQLRPDDPTVALNLALLYQLQGKPEPAAEYARLVLAKQPANDTARHLLNELTKPRQP